MTKQVALVLSAGIKLVNLSAHWLKSAISDRLGTVISKNIFVTASQYLTLAHQTLLSQLSHKNLYPAQNNELLNYIFVVALEHRAHRASSIYYNTHKRIYQTLKNINTRHPSLDLSIIWVTHGLSGYLISNYTWDAQKKELRQGVFHCGQPVLMNQTQPQQAFFSVKTLRCLLTTACIIELWVARKNHVQAIFTPQVGYNLRWYNFYQSQDEFSRPLRSLAKFSVDHSHQEQSYDLAVTCDSVLDHHPQTASLTNTQNSCNTHHYWHHPQFIDVLPTQLNQSLMDYH